MDVDDIEWVEAADHYACLHVGSRNLTLRETIRQLADTLDPPQVRARSPLGNRQYRLRPRNP